MRRRPPRSTQSRSSAASDVYKRQVLPPAWPKSRLKKSENPPDPPLEEEPKVAPSVGDGPPEVPVNHCSKSPGSREWDDGPGPLAASNPASLYRSQSEPYRSYIDRFSGSDRTSCASLSSLNLDSASGLSRLRSG